MEKTIKAGHTPGPWTRYGFSVYAEDGMPICQCATQYLADTLEEGDWKEFNISAERDEKETNANAILLARSPAMLSLLKFFAYDAALTIEEVRSMAREEIEKVEGKA